MAPLARILASLGAAAGAGITLAIGLAVTDMYLAGHGRHSSVTQPAFGAFANTSWGDVILLSSAFLAFVGLWLMSGRGS